MIVIVSETESKSVAATVIKDGFHGAALGLFIGVTPTQIPIHGRVIGYHVRYLIKMRWIVESSR